MKVFSRDFTLTEKILLLILALILLALAYYWLVDQNVRYQIASAESERDATRIELDAVQARVGRLKRMQAELEDLGGPDGASRMESYNNAKAELAALNNILSSADSYSINFTSVTRNGDQIRRNFDLQFTVGSNDQVRDIVERLCGNELRCQIGNLRYSGSWSSATAAANAGGSQALTYRYVITVNAAATFFETMFDGVPDAGLPADSAAKTAAASEEDAA